MKLERQDIGWVTFHIIAIGLFGSLGWWQLFVRGSMGWFLFDVCLVAWYLYRLLRLLVK